MHVSQGGQNGASKISLTEPRTTETSLAMVSGMAASVELSDASGGATMAVCTVCCIVVKTIPALLCDRLAASSRKAAPCAPQASADVGALVEARRQQSADPASEPARPPPPSTEDKARAAALCKTLVDETEGLVLEALEVCHFLPCSQLPQMMA